MNQFNKIIYSEKDLENLDSLNDGDEIHIDNEIYTVNTYRHGNNYVWYVYLVNNKQTIVEHLKIDDRESFCAKYLRHASAGLMYNSRGCNDICAHSTWDMVNLVRGFYLHNQ